MPKAAHSNSWVLVADRREVQGWLAKLQRPRTSRHRHLKVIQAYQGGQSISVGILGMGSARSQEALSLLLHHYPVGKAVIAGVVGGLSPQMQPGDVFLAPWIDQGAKDSILPGRLALPHHPEIEQLADELGVCLGGLLTMDTMVASIQQKAELFARSQAIGVDMETYGLVKRLQTASVQSLVVRSVSDAAHEALPTALAAFAAPSASFIDKGLALLRASRDPHGLSLWTLKQRMSLCSASLEAVLPRILQTFLLDKKLSGS